TAAVLVTAAAEGNAKDSSPVGAPAAVSAPDAKSTPPPAPWQQTVSEPAFAEFKHWTSRYLSADPAQKTKLEAEGVRLAAPRRHAMADMITAQPERALALVVPYGVRR